MSFNQTLEMEIPAPIVFVEQPISPRSRLIHETAISSAGRFRVAEAELLNAIMSVDLDRTYEKFGLTHLTPYCTKYLRLSEDVAACFVRVARKSIQVPALKDAIANGELTVSKAKTIASVVTVQNQEAWIEKATAFSKEKLERAVAEASPSASKSERAKTVGTDRVRIEMEITQEQMQLLRRAQDLASQKLRKSASLSETQMLMLSCFLDNHDPVRKADRALDRKSRKSRSKSKTRPKSQFMPTPEPSHRSRDRSHQIRREKIPAAVLHAVHQRDRGVCQARMADGALCESGRWTHGHHIVSVADGGSDSAENLVTLCSAHHRLWHSR